MILLALACAPLENLGPGGVWVTQTADALWTCEHDQARCTPDSWGDLGLAEASDTLWSIDTDGDGADELLLDDAWCQQDSGRWQCEPVALADTIIWVGDTDGDGLDDVLTREHQSILRRCPGTPSGPGACETLVETGFSYLLGAVPADLNNDGRTDLLLSDRNGDDNTTVPWLCLATEEGFSCKETLDSTLGDLALAGDMNGDGRTDLLIGSSLSASVVPELCLGDHFGCTGITVAEYLNRDLTSWPGGFVHGTLVDLDNDGDLDLAFASPAGPQHCTNSGDGVLRCVRLYTDLGWPELGRWCEPCSTGVAAGDADGDGDTDLFSAINFSDGGAAYLCDSQPDAGLVCTEIEGPTQTTGSAAFLSRVF